MFPTVDYTQNELVILNEWNLCNIIEHDHNMGQKNMDNAC